MKERETGEPTESNIHTRGGLGSERWEWIREQLRDESQPDYIIANHLSDYADAVTTGRIQDTDFKAREYLDRTDWYTFYGILIDEYTETHDRSLLSPALYANFEGTRAFSLRDHVLDRLELMEDATHYEYDWDKDEKRWMKYAIDPTGNVEENPEKLEDFDKHQLQQIFTVAPTILLPIETIPPENLYQNMRRELAITGINRYIWKEQIADETPEIELPFFLFRKAPQVFRKHFGVTPAWGINSENQSRIFKPISNPPTKESFLLKTIPKG